MIICLKDHTFNRSNNTIDELGQVMTELEYESQTSVLLDFHDPSDEFD